MQIGDHLEIPGVRGAADLVCDLPPAETTRRVKVYLVPESVSADRYFISITQIGAVESVPPSRSRDTVMLTDFSQDGTGGTTIHFVYEEVENA